MTSVALISAGLDSTVAFHEALASGGVSLALTFDYAQRAARQEASRASQIAGAAGVAHRLMELPWLAELSGSSALSQEGPELPSGDEVDLDSAAAPAALWIPNRNGLFVAIAAAFAESTGADSVVAGLNAEEARSFPDNSAEFVAAATGLLSHSTLSKVRLEAPMSGMTKAEIVARGIELGAPLDMIWCCYRGGEVHCGRCESCLRARRAFTGAGAPVKMIPPGLAEDGE